MKKNSFLLFSIFFCLSLCNTSCKKHYGSKPLSQLPPATQTGANTFGCLINGKAFTAGGSFLSGRHLGDGYGYFYVTPVPQPLPYQNPDGYGFGIWGSDLRNTENITTVKIEIDSIPTIAGNSYILQRPGAGNGSGTLEYLGTQGPGYTTQTSDKVTGEVYISRLDTVSRIMSGTFWFNALDPKGDTKKISNGRFDAVFSN